MRSNVNLSRIVRTAGCCGVTTVICSGNAKIVEKIARDAVEGSSEDGADSGIPGGVEIKTHRTLLHPLLQLKADGYRLVGLEQTNDSQSLFDYEFKRRCVLVVGNERSGMNDELLKTMDDIVEIPVYGLPHALNAATAASIALYEYCRQFPHG